MSLTNSWIATIIEALLVMDISLIFGSGSLSHGFECVVANVDGKKQCQGSLPRNEKLVELQRRWLLLYQALLQRFNSNRRSVFEVDEGDVTNISEASFQETCQEIREVFNQWLTSDSFQEIIHTLHQQLGKAEPTESIRVMIQNSDRGLQKLPWHLWDYVENNPQVGISLSSLNYDVQSPQGKQSNQVRVLAIFGDSTGIDLNQDRATLENFTNADITFLEEPSRQQFNDQLWDQQWDVLFFAGHSNSNSNQSGGEIGLNATESLSLPDLKNGLRTAIDNGLKLAIFNSCDGLELAHLLGELNLPQLIVMQADVPNPVAQHFLNYFLKALIDQGKSIELAHRQAKERLEGVENDYPGATWLPVLFQNPNIHWHPSSHSPMRIDWSAIAQEMLTHQVTSNPLTNRDGKRFDLDDIFVPLGLVERRKVEKKKDSTSAEDGSDFYQQEEVTRRYERDEFLDDVLTQGNTPKSQGKRLAIIGEPGAGKTTQLQKMGDWLTSQGNHVVIWVSLADLQGQTLEDYLLTEWLKKALKTPRVNSEQEEKFINLFREQSVWLLLDGVDEMGESTPLQQLAGQLRQGWLSSARVILTCRLNVWDAGKNALDEFDVYRNLDFSDELRQEFTQKWFQESPELAEALEQELNRPGKERIRNLVKNPLRLTLLCAFWQRRQGELPETKAQLYKLFVDIFYEWKEESFPITTAQKRELNQALGRLAKQAIDQPSGRFRLSNKLVCSVLGDEETSLFQSAIDIGWLNQVGVAQENPDEPVFAFFHPTFEEYFAAITIDDWHFFLTHYPSNPQQGVYRIFEPQWKEVFLLWLGRKEIDKKEKESLIEALWNFNTDCGSFYLIRSRFLATVAIGEFKDYQGADEIIEWAFKIAYGDLDEKTNQWQRNYVYQEFLKDALLESDSIRVVTKSIDFLRCHSLFFLYYSEPICEIINRLSPKNPEFVNILDYLLSSDSKLKSIPQNPYDEKSIKTLMAELILKIDPDHQEANSVIESNLNLSSTHEMDDNLEDPFENLPVIYCDIDDIPAEEIPSDIIYETLCDDFFSNRDGSRRKDVENSSYSRVETPFDLIDKIKSSNEEERKQGILLLANKFNKDYRLIEFILDIFSSDAENNVKSDMRKYFKVMVKTFRDNNYIKFLLIEKIQNEANNEMIKLSSIEILSAIYTYQGSDFDRYQIDHPDFYYYLLNLISETNNEKVCVEAMGILGHRLDTDLDIKNIAIKNDQYRHLDRVTAYHDQITSCMLDAISRFSNNRVCLSAVGVLNRFDTKELSIINPLKRVIQSEEDPNSVFQAIIYLHNLLPNDVDLLYHLRKLIQKPPDNKLVLEIIIFWSQEVKNKEAIPVIIPRLKPYTSDNKYYSILFHCAQNISYPEFYQAWHSQQQTPHPEVEATDPAEFNPSLEQQYLPETLSKLEATANVYPIPIDADCLVEETDKSAIAQELLNQIYETTFPDVNPPTANNAPEITRNLPEIEHRLQVNELALILYNCEPESNSELKNLCRQLSRKLKMAWITEQPLEPPLQGFQLQPNLGTVIQNWLNEI